ncbi:YfgM family protein [Solilutibacter pythonis]|nr:tetratricopeptide repeat protein [Lysobacter pythonis]
MDELLNEHEQGERVRSWLQRNALSLIGGIGLGLGLIYGWQWWQSRQAAESQSQAMAYADFEKQLVASPETAAKAYDKIGVDTPYAALAGLELAKARVDMGKEAEALALLRKIKTGDAGIRAVIDQRIARLLVDTGKPAEAVALLGKGSDAAALEILGDAQARLGQGSLAKAAYQQALRSLEEGSPQRQLVELKLAEVGGNPEDGKAG